MKAVAPPETGIVRIGRLSRQIFAAPPPTLSGTGRFDDPYTQGQRGDPGVNPYLVIYGASTLSGALAEVLQRFRPDLIAVAEAPGHVGSADGIRWIDGKPCGVLSSAWIATRVWATATLAPGIHCVDIVASETLAELRRDSRLARLALACGLKDIDVSAVTGPQRRFTQACARHIYENDTECGGVRFSSRFSTDHEFECWALFADRARFDAVSEPIPLRKDMPELQAIAAQMDIVFEG